MSDESGTPVPYVFDLRFPWDEREGVRAERAIAKQRDGYRTAVGIAAAAGGVVALLSVVEVAAEGTAAAGALLALVLPAASLFLIAPWVVLRVLPDTIARRNRKPARWSPGQRVAASEDDLVVELPGDAALIPWSAVSKVVETDEFLFFLRHEGRGVYVPKRAFRDRAQLEALRLFARNRVSPAAVLAWPGGSGEQMPLPRPPRTAMPLAVSCAGRETNGMSRAFVKDDAGSWGTPGRRFGLPPREDPDFDAAAAAALLEAARDGDTGAAEQATGYYWGEPKLRSHVEQILERARQGGDERLAQLAERFLW